ncbi:ATP-dependent DNA helicase 2 subunit 1 [Apiospora kogelbergensis]|uniref:ATP-dependent DNA helicase 2 subunit 1 n=1 Tax=Apiospora kogelbergensis TaxID=1337665 RepID=A0AAW0QS93_9PEZI
MDALLSSIAQSVRAENHSNSNACDSIEDICQSLANYVARRTDTRAEHISNTFEVRQKATFDIVVETDIAGGEDPGHQLHQLQPLVTRTVNAADTVLDQPADDPVLQRMVAKHIISAVGQVDGSFWNVRKVSRGAQGWDFTYQCKHSLEEWKRQNAKSTGRLPIAAWSGPGGQDPINMARPAFDCRGTVSIMFSRTNRAIMIKYEHTPLHKTVAELADLLAPVIPPPVPNGNHVGTKSTKAKRPPPAEGDESTPKRKKKRRSKALDEEADQDVPEGPVTPAQEAANPGQDSTSASAPAATQFLDISAEEAARRKELAVGLLIGKGIDPSTLSEEQMNIFSNQAPHLREQSLEMFAKYGAERLRIVHPDKKDQPASATTTPAQGTPNVVDVTISGPSTAAPGDTETPTKKRKPRKKKSDAAAESVDDTAASRAVEPGNAENGGMETTLMTLKPTTQRKTRGTCDTCKTRKVKCTKEHPVCSVCEEAGETCVYLPPRPRRKSEKPAEKSAETVDQDIDVQAEDDEGHAAELEQAEQPGQGEPTPIGQPVQITPVPVPRPMQAVQQAAPVASAPVIDLDNDEFIPDPNILSGPIEQPQPAAPQSTNTDYFSSNGDMTYSDAEGSEAARYAHQAMANLTFPSSQFHRDTSQVSPALSFPSATQPTQPPLAYSQPQSVAQSQPTRQSSRNTNRRSLPTGPATHHQRTDAGITAAAPNRSTTGWNNPSHPPTVPAQDTTRSPNILQAQAPSQAAKQRPKSRKAGNEAQAHAHPSPNTMQAAMTLSQSVSQKTNHVPPGTRSPYQTTRKPAGRTQSRQGHRSQTNTPVTQTPVPPPQLPASFNTPPNAYGHANAPATTVGYDTYGRYTTSNNQYHNTATAGDAGAQSSYEPDSYQAQSTTTAGASYTAPSYDYSRSSGGAAGASTAHDTSNYSAANASNSSSNQWTSAQARGSRSDTTHSYHMPATQAAPTSPYGTRSTSRQASQAGYSQSQQPSYSSYQAHGANQPHQSQSNQTWYGFPAASTGTSNHTSYNSNTANTSYASTGASTNTGTYASHRPNMPGYPAGYADDSTMFDLLSRGHSAN